MQITSSLLDLVWWALIRLMEVGHLDACSRAEQNDEETERGPQGTFSLLLSFLCVSLSSEGTKKNGKVIFKRRGLGASTDLALQCLL